jgi:hypothetical protein
MSQASVARSSPRTRRPSKSRPPDMDLDAQTHRYEGDREMLLIKALDLDHLPYQVDLYSARIPALSTAKRAYSAFSGALTLFRGDLQDLGVVDMSATFPIRLVIAAVRAAPS